MVKSGAICGFFFGEDSSKLRQSICKWEEISKLVCKSLKTNKI